MDRLAPLSPPTAAGPSSRTPRRVLFVVNDAWFFVSHRLPLALAARARGYEIHVAAHEDAAADELRALGFPFYPLNLDRVGMAPGREARLILQIAALVRRVRPTLLHGVTIKPVLYGGLVARLLGVPAFIATVSGLGQALDRQNADLRRLRSALLPLYRRALAHPNGRIIFQNPDDMAECVEGGLADPRRSVLIPGSGVDPTRFRPTPEAEGEPIVALPARLLWPKGVGDFVEAARLLRAKGRRARFVLVGEPPANDPNAVPVERLRAWCEDGVIEWWGHRSDMPRVHAQASVVCLPSFYREGVPKTLIEAAACARPVVTTDMPGCREICRHGHNGLLTPPNDPPALAEALDALLADPQRRRAMGAAGRELARVAFSLQGVLDRTLAVYEEVTAATGGSRTGLGLLPERERRAW